MMSKKKFWQKEITLLAILIAVCLILFFFRLGERALWDIDEGMHATTSKDMVLSGDWLTPQYNGEKFYDKPPLHNWLVAISFLLFGFKEFAARLPAALLGLGCVLVTYAMGRNIFGPIAGFLCAVVLATSAEYIVLSRVVVHDISLAFFITLALTLFYLGYKNERYRKRVFLFGYAAMGFSVLAKGPVGVLIPTMIIGLFLIFKRQLSYLKEMQVGWGIFVFLAVASPWYILISLKDPDYISYFFINQNLGSFFSQEARHPQPIYYYIPILMGGMFPWSTFLPFALFRALRERWTALEDGMLFALIWFGVIFIFFSLASSKLGTYILPLFPAASLLIGALWYDLLYGSTRGLFKGIFYSYLPLVIILPLALVYIFLYPPITLKVDSGIDLERVYYLTAWIVFCVFLTMGLVAKKKYKAFIGAIAGKVITVFLFTLLFLVPQIDPFRSGKGLAQKIDKLLSPKESLVFYDKERDSFLFYTNRMIVILETQQQLKEFMATDKPVYCIFKRDDWEDVGMLHHAMHIVAEEGHMLIASNIKPGS